MILSILQVHLENAAPVPEVSSEATELAPPRPRYCHFQLTQIHHQRKSRVLGNQLMPLLTHGLCIVKVDLPRNDQLLI